jgi:glycosyltransferase involved in cell wall biosynthesis
MKREVLVFPYWNINPYLNLLYLDAQSQGIDIVRLDKYEQLVAALTKSRPGQIFHIHSTELVVQKAMDAAEAQSRVAELIQLFAAAKAKGAKLVWSVHNVLPHESRFYDIEIRLLDAIAANADRIHVLAESTAEQTAGHFSFDDKKVAVVQHSSFWGVYDQTMPDDEARKSFGLGANDNSVLFLGQMRAYKGLHLLIAAVKELNLEGANLKLLLAGSAKPKHRREIQKMIGEDPNIQAKFSFIENDDLQRWFKAADVAVLPFQQILNSGSLYLAASFGVPTIAPALGNLPSLFSSETWATLYDPNDPKQQIKEALVARFNPNTRATEKEKVMAAKAFAANNRPWQMSKEFTLKVLQPLFSTGA